MDIRQVEGTVISGNGLDEYREASKKYDIGDYLLIIEKKKSFTILSASRGTKLQSLESKAEPPFPDISQVMGDKDEWRIFSENPYI